MKKITPYFDNPPSELLEDATRYRNHTKENPEGKSKIRQALADKEKHDFDNNVYGSTAVKSKLREIFKDKCAFCETNTNAGASHDVEHFRFTKHYYWLGYEWTNLLLSCQICNRIYKKTQFPLEKEENRIHQAPLDSAGTLITAQCHILHKPLSAEKPLLLHPAIDDPTKHLKFVPNGSIEGISEKGKNSIEVYGLERDELIKKRKSIIKGYQKDLLRIYQYETPTNQRITIEINRLISKILDQIENPSTEYWSFYIAILNNFEDFIINNTSNEMDLPNKEVMRAIVRPILTPSA